MVLQTNMNEILSRIEDQNKIQKAEAGISVSRAGASRAVTAMKNINLPQIKEKVLDLGTIKFWPRAMAIETSTLTNPASLSNFKLDYYQTEGYTELKGDIKKQT